MRILLLLMMIGMGIRFSPLWDTVIQRYHGAKIISMMKYGLVKYSDMSKIEQGQITPSDYQDATNWFRGQTNLEILELSYKSGEGVVQAHILKPKTGDSAKFPAIIYNRPGFGNFSANNLYTFYRDLRFLAENGFVVLTSQYRSFEQVEGGDEIGGEDIADVINLVSIAKFLDFIDRSKISMMGVGRGGMMTYLALREGVDVRSALVLGGWSDFYQLVKDNPDLETKILQRKVKNLYVNRDEHFRKRSAVFWADEINTPLFILHGEYDSEVSLQQSKLMATALERANKNFEITIYPGMGHELIESSDVRQDILVWLREHSGRAGAG